MSEKSKNKKELNKLVNENHSCNKTEIIIVMNLKLFVYFIFNVKRLWAVGQIILILLFFCR